MPALVTVHLWRVRRSGVPGALARMAVHRRELARTPGLRFAKLFGTGRGRTFTPRDADPRRWGLLATWSSTDAARAFDGSRAARSWARVAETTWRADLLPLASRGRWAGREPFGNPSPRPWDGAVASLTRARLAPRHAVAFWRAVPPVAAELAAAPGLRLALGIGEAPVGLQGTFSVWRDHQALEAFAYGRPEHRAVIDRTPREGWYAEELFARFAVVATSSWPRAADADESGPRAAS